MFGSCPQTGIGSRHFFLHQRRQDDLSLLPQHLQARFAGGGIGFVAMVFVSARG